MDLFYAPGTVALASGIALEEAGIPYTPHRVDFASSEQRGAAYLALNPKGRVPSLVTERGVLTETPAILRYIATLNPGAGLWPADPFEAARLDEVCAYLCSTVHVSHAHKFRGTRWSDDPEVIEGMKVKVTENMTEHFRLLSGMIRGPYLLGETFSMADAYVHTLALWLPGDGVDPASLPVIAAHGAAMAARPAVQRARARLV